MKAEATKISVDMVALGERINNNPKLKEQLFQFLKMAYPLHRIKILNRSSLLSASSSVAL
jgi:hypothetical protein